MSIPEPGRIAVVGATGLVGRELTAVLREMGLHPFAAAAPPPSCDICVLATPEDVSRSIVEGSPGVRTVDMSAAFRSDDTVPLVVPSLNRHELTRSPTLVASPNCTATILALAISPFMAWGIDHVVVTTCQAASGGGEAALQALEAQTRAALAGETGAGGDWAFNVFCHESPIDPATGRSGEEQKVIDETRRILSLPGLDIAPTCLRVPVRRAHVESITLTLASDITLDAARDALHAGADLRLLDDRLSHAFPSTRSAEDRDTVDVGHLRLQGRRVSFIAAGDQLRIGAALNAARIVQTLLRVQA